MKPIDVNCVISHKNCPDGWGAAWAAWKLLGDKAEYHFLAHGEEPPDVSNKNVLMVDFAFSDPSVMNKMIDDANDFLLLDHHKTAQESLDGKINCKYVFDMNKSGAMLSWKFFHPETNVPPMILYIQDRDLWKWKLPDARKYLASFDSYIHSFEQLDDINNSSTENMILEGVAICRFQQVLVHDSVKSSIESFLHCPDGSLIKVRVVNNPVKELVSDIANILSDENFIGAAWWYSHDNGKIRVSLRSIGDIDVAAIAQKFPGGGGHKNASGFEYDGNIKSLFCQEKRTLGAYIKKIKYLINWIRS